MLSVSCSISFQRVIALLYLCQIFYTFNFNIEIILSRFFLFPSYLLTCACWIFCSCWNVINWSRYDININTEYKMLVLSDIIRPYSELFYAFQAEEYILFLSFQYKLVPLYKLMYIITVICPQLLLFTFLRLYNYPVAFKRLK